LAAKRKKHDVTIAWWHIEAEKQKQKERKNLVLTLNVLYKITGFCLA